MLRMRFWGRFLCAAALLAAVPAVHAQTTSPGMSLDDEYAKMAEKVPGFGGLYLDEKGTTHVYLQDLTRAGEMQGLADRVIFEQGDYDFRDLYAWREQVRPELNVPGAVYLDVDERRNRIVFGAQPELLDRFSEELRLFLGKTRVPPEAVIVEPSAPFQAYEMLTDKIRPIPAGVEITTSSPGKIGFCSLGVNATRLGVRGFVTAAHCTSVEGALDGQTFFQNLPGSTNQIGVETVDPSFFTGGSCPPGRKCRRSDAAFIAYNSASLSAGGKIANPLVWAWGLPGLLTVNPITPRIPVTGFLFGSVSSGAVEYKVGQTTGGTFGSVTNTCVDVIELDVNNKDVGMTLLCQDLSSIFSAGGDSGSPIFVQSGGKATLAGILWGGNGSLTSYSPWLFVFTELGATIFPDAP
jgi:hypothetical protein